MKTFNTTFLAIVLTLFTLEGSAAPLTARPVQIVSCASMPDDVPFDVAPMSYNKGFEIFYLVEAENLAAFKDNSLTLTSMKTKDGKDISKTRTGKPSYEEGTFPKVSEDGKYAVFSVKVEQDLFGQVDSLEIAGSAILLVASSRDVLTAKLSKDEKKAKTVGPFTVSTSAGGGFMGMGGDSFGVTVKGSLASIINVDVESNGAALDSEGSMSDGSSKTFYFAKPDSDALTVKINYWTDLKEETVTFGK